ncbi:MAG TPA: hypothetical protein VJ866_11480 [Pyrinomonadaceae bacterium]|nr:hypothetical protein [Pyrinomonadaceae bacterium]
MKRLASVICLLALCCHTSAAQLVQRDDARTLLGVRLGAEVSAWLEEVEGKLGREVYAEFAELDAADAGGDYTLGTSYLTRAGVAVLRVDESFRARGEQQTRAVIAHELLHLRLRARGYPLFLFSPTVQTRRGPAEDVEQEHVNDLVSMIEHRVFAAEMRRTGFDRLIDLTTGLDAARRRGRTPDGQAEMLNYARASLEWNDDRLVDEFAAVYRANGWTRSLEGGRRLADIIRAADIRAPADVAPVFLRCMSVLYGASFRVEPDRRFALSKIYTQLLIYAERPRGRR